MEQNLNMYLVRVVKPSQGNDENENLPCHLNHHEKDSCSCESDCQHSPEENGDQYVKLRLIC